MEYEEREVKGVQRIVLSEFFDVYKRGFTKFIITQASNILA